jgi:hypothetical protein
MFVIMVAVSYIILDFIKKLHAVTNLLTHVCAHASYDGDTRWIHLMMHSSLIK